MATQRFQLLVTLYRTADGAVKEDILKFSSPPNTVGDLKIAVETQYDIPRCLQTIEIGDRCIRSDDDRLSDHYVFTGDSIKVIYLYEAYVNHARELKEHLQRLEQHLVLVPRKTFTWFDSELSCVMESLEFFSYEVLSAHVLDDSIYANCKCLAQVGTTDAVVSLLRYIQVNFPRSERSQMKAELNYLEYYCLTYFSSLAWSIETQEQVNRNTGAGRKSRRI